RERTIAREELAQVIFANRESQISNPNSIVGSCLRGLLCLFFFLLFFNGLCRKVDSLLFGFAQGFLRGRFWSGNVNRELVSGELSLFLISFSNAGHFDL